VGLFSSKTKTTVGTTAVRVIPDDGLPNSIRTGLQKSLFDPAGGDIPGYIMEEFISSMGPKVERMYRYAEDHYTHGLPTGEYYTKTQGQPEAKTVIEALEGTTITFDYYRFGSPNSLHIAWSKLVTDYGFNHNTNQFGPLSVTKGTPVYLKDMYIAVPEDALTAIEADGLEQWGVSAKGGYTPERPVQVGDIQKIVPHTPIVLVPGDGVPYAVATYVWADGTNYLTEYINISLAGYVGDADYFHAKYYRSDSPIPKYWMYRAGSGLYPALDATFDDPPVVNGSYFPFIYFRYDKASVMTNTAAPEYVSSKKMMKILGMDYAQLGEGINENPDIGDVEQAMMVFAIPANTTNQLEQRYLYDFFLAQYNSIGPQYRVVAQADLAGLLANNYDLAKTTVVIQDEKFKMALHNRGIFKKRIAGKLGPIGTYTSGTTTIYEEIPYYDIIAEVMGSYFQDIPVHYYRKQISESIYEEISVHALQMVYHIYGEYTETANGTEPILLVPLDKLIIENYSAHDREVLYCRAMYFVFNSVVLTKVKWYQQEWFSVFMIAVAIVLTIVTYGAAWQTIAAAVAAGTMSIAALTVIIAMGVLKFLIVSLIVKLFIRVVGIEAAIIIALIAAAAGMYTAIQAGGLSGAPFAQNLLQLSTSIGSGVQDEIKSLMGDLLAEANEFSTFMEKQTETLEKAKDLLDVDSFLSPFTIFGESPDSYFNRTVHSGNIGVVGITAISSYVDIALTLPTLDQSLGGSDGIY